MASPLSSSFLSISILLFIYFLSLSSSSVNGQITGGIFEVEDVKTNKQVQELGKYSVGEYNQKFRKGLTFIEVVQAQKQVIAGFKYYLKVSAIENGKLNLYDAIVVDRTWTNPSKELIIFNPSS
ncbi:hypothetical protein MKX03_004007 [Papaver bracteatum]|nr:hypothetical protein MKX03_004007 [Papaver bracteatum]